MFMNMIKYFNEILISLFDIANCASLKLSANCTRD